MSRKTTGDEGEVIACRYLCAKGYTILTTNWHCREGEIDIVAQDGEALVFVEVKTRRGLKAGETLVSITPAKRRRMIAAAYAYASQTGEFDPVWRIDALAVCIGSDGMASCTHVENALDW